MTAVFVSRKALRNLNENYHKWFLLRLGFINFIWSHIQLGFGAFKARLKSSLICFSYKKTIKNKNGEEMDKKKKGGGGNDNWREKRTLSTLHKNFRNLFLTLLNHTDIPAMISPWLWLALRSCLTGWGIILHEMWLCQKELYKICESPMYSKKYIIQFVIHSLLIVFACSG